jgi:hypothetical protein
MVDILARLVEPLKGSYGGSIVVYSSLTRNTADTFRHIIDTSEYAHRGAEGTAEIRVRRTKTRSAGMDEAVNRKSKGEQIGLIAAPTMGQASDVMG